MNNYLKLLLYLKKFEGDGKMHFIEHLFPETTIEEIRNILIELAEEGLIKYSGREERSLSFFVEKNIVTGETKTTQSPFNEHILNSKPEEFKGKITFKGSKYLKEELQMQDMGKYNIAVTGPGANNTFVIESQNVKIKNESTFNDQVDRVIAQIDKDDTIESPVKVELINDLQLAKKEFNQKGKVPQELIKNIFQYGSDISSIGQLLLGLFSIG